jgi:hypothetical protein
MEESDGVCPHERWNLIVDCSTSSWEWRLQCPASCLSSIENRKETEEAVMYNRHWPEADIFNREMNWRWVSPGPTVNLQWASNRELKTENDIQWWSVHSVWVLMIGSWSINRWITGKWEDNNLPSLWPGVCFFYFLVIPRQRIIRQEPVPEWDWK